MCIPSRSNKKAEVVALVKRSKGATLAEIITAFLAPQLWYSTGSPSLLTEGKCWHDSHSLDRIYARREGRSAKRLVISTSCGKASRSMASLTLLVYHRRSGEHALSFEASRSNNGSRETILRLGRMENRQGLIFLRSVGIGFGLLFVEHPSMILWFRT